MAFSWDNCKKRGQRIFKRRKRILEKTGNSKEAKDLDRKIK